MKRLAGVAIGLLFGCSQSESSQPGGGNTGKSGAIDANGGSARMLPTGGSSGASAGGTAGAAAGGTLGTGAGNAGAGGTGAAGSAGTSGAAGTGTGGSDGGPPIYPPCDGSTVYPPNARLTALGANQAIDLGRFTCSRPA